MIKTKLVALLDDTDKLVKRAGTLIGLPFKRAGAHGKVIFLAKGPNSGIQDQLDKKLRAAGFTKDHGESDHYSSKQYQMQAMIDKQPGTAGDYLLTVKEI